MFPRNRDAITLALLVLRNRADTIRNHQLARVNGGAGCGDA